MYRDGKIHEMSFKKGIPQNSLTITGDTEIRGTQVHFKPDSGMFGITEFSYEILTRRLQEMAYLNKGLTIEITDLREDRTALFSYEGGISSMVQNHSKSRTPIHPELLPSPAIGTALRSTSRFVGTGVSRAGALLHEQYPE